MKFSKAIALTFLISVMAFGRQSISYGIVVSTRRTGSSEGTSTKNWGKIQRYDINNNSLPYVKGIYTGTNARCANIVAVSDGDLKVAGVNDQFLSGINTSPVS